MNMKPHWHLHCFKFSTQPELSRVAAFFNLPFSKNSDYLPLGPEAIRTVLKEQSSDKYVWLFRYGCICLMNFEPLEIYRFLKFLESTCGVDYHLFSTYNESHVLEEEDPADLQPKTAAVYAHILAKSTELKYMEDTLAAQFDRSEIFINELHKGWFNSDNSMLKSTTVQMVRYQLQILHSLRILDRPAEYNAHLALRRRYDEASAEYELHKRFAIIQRKLDELHGILTPYQKLNHAQKAQRLIMMEVFLLSLFPLPYLVKLIVPKILTFLANM